METVDVNIDKLYGWSFYLKHGVKLWFKGYSLESNVEEIHTKIILIIKESKYCINDLERVIKDIRGHFALVIESKNLFFMSVDQISSIPLFYSQIGNVLSVSPNATTLRDKMSTGSILINNQAVLEVTMSGCTLLQETMIDKLCRLDAGNYLYIEKDILDLNIVSYYKYWDDVFIKKKTDFDTTIREIFSKYIKYLNGRQVIVPLSGGNDSRLVVSMLREFNYENVICFTFGKEGCFEHGIAKNVSSKLGYRWVPIYQTRKKVREYLGSQEAKKYYQFSETYSNPPGMLDIFAIKELVNKVDIANDAVIINGHTGDFISGSHIPSGIPYNVLNHKTCKLDKLSKPFLSKHFSLWNCYRNRKNDSKITHKLNSIVESYLRTGRTVPEYIIFETLELLTRQSKLILGNQKGYDFYNLTWMLPFWDKEYLKYWSSQPIENKIGGSYYKQELIRYNYGGVWQEIPVNKKTIPIIAKLFRNIFKPFFIFSKKKKWISFDKRWFYYFYEDSANIGIIRYFETIIDRCGFRNTLSWRVLKYVRRVQKSTDLTSHNINIKK
jgi:asparagine synthase (glutamine-hydrolysing)